MITAAGAGRVKVHQVLATLSYGDAIGHEVLAIQQVLRRAGFESDIFVETADDRLEHLTRDYRELRAESHPDDVFIHHFSLSSKASRVAYALPERMILVYHNITPPEYFLGVHGGLTRQCYAGRRELRAYASRCELALGDSEFNRQELEQLGFAPTGVLPVVPGFAHLDVPPNPLLAGGFDDERTTILFVGRVIPNKRIEDLIRCYHAYRIRHNPQSRLIIVGSTAGFEGYRMMLDTLVARLEAPDVIFTGHVSNEELTAFYDVADLFLCMSEHEGFCVPLMEAFSKRIPVLAYAAAAVPETLDGGGVLFDLKDPVRVAALMHAVLSDPDRLDAILAAQDAALERLQAQDFAGTLVGFVERVLECPRRARPHTVADFWQQYDDAERLEELRLFRPAAFAARASGARRARGAP